MGVALKVYLLTYNLLLVGGWLWILLGTLQGVVSGSTAASIYQRLSIWLQLAQSAAIMEIVHAVSGVVKSSPIVTGLQVLSRLNIVWGILYSVPSVEGSVGVTLCLFAWSVTEVIRYGYYACSLVNCIPYPLQWARYSLFIILYPIGVTGEMITLFTAMPIVRTMGIYSIPMPNRANFSFRYEYLLVFAVLLYLPYFPKLYGHMWSQRRKILGGKEKKTE